MTTARPEDSHLAREVAESFGTDAERYDRARPSYPDALIDTVLAGSPGTNVLDIGVGTGIVARQFLQRGCTVLGIDPDARMAERASATGVPVEVATIEAWEPAGRRFDAAVAGMTWHWVDPVKGAAKAREALVGGGLLALFWNVAQAPRELDEGFAEVFRRVVPEFPAYSAGDRAGRAYDAFLDKAADGMRVAGGFGEPEVWRFDWDLDYTRDAWLDHVPTSGGFSRIDPRRQQALLEGIGQVIDRAGGGFTMHWTTATIGANTRR